MANFPTGTDLPADAATDTSETLATMCDGQGQGAAFNQVKNGVGAVYTKIGTGTSSPTRGTALIASGAGTSIWGTLSRRNLLINGDFRIWQRGASPTVVDNGYGPDRWRLLLGAANAFTIAQEASDVPTIGGKNGFRLTVGSGNNNKGGIFQPLEGVDIKHLRGQAVSLQVKLKATANLTNTRIAICEFTGTEDSISGDPISAWNSTGTNPTLAASWAYLNTPASLAVTTSYVTYRVENVTVGASANNLAVFIWSDATTTTTTTDILRGFDVQLEEGAACTEIERRHYGNELLLCQRYYWKNFPGDPTAGSQAAPYRVWTASIANNEYYVDETLPIQMRGTPVVTCIPYTTPANTGRSSNGSGTDYGANSAVASGGSSRKIAVQNTSGGALTVTANGLIHLGITASAEL